MLLSLKIVDKSGDRLLASKECELNMVTSVHASGTDFIPPTNYSYYSRNKPLYTEVQIALRLNPVAR